MDTLYCISITKQYMHLWAVFFLMFYEKECNPLSEQSEELLFFSRGYQFSTINIKQATAFLCVSSAFGKDFKG